MLGRIGKAHITVLEMIKLLTRLSSMLVFLWCLVMYPNSC